MIYDRSYIDIVNAKKIFSNKIQKFIELTAEEQNTIDRAYFNLTAINRITAKIDEIWLEIVTYGGTKTENEDVREWVEEDIFNIVNFSNIRQNISDIIAQLAILEFVDADIYQNAHSKLTDDYTYTNLNNLEKLLYDIYNIFNEFVIVINDTFYLLGSYNVIESGGELTIE